MFTVLGYCRQAHNLRCMLVEQSLQSCPACNSTNYSSFDWEYGCPGSSVFSRKFHLNQCKSCSHIFLSDIRDSDLQAFYSIESIYSNSQHFSIDDSLNVQKYQSYLETIQPYLQASHPISVFDYGCGAGGFLLHLESSYPELLASNKLQLYGYDSDPRMREISRNNLSYSTIIWIMF